MVVEAVVTARAPIVLGLVAILLAAYIFWFERDRPRRNEVDAREGFLVPALIRERISTIRLAGDGDAFSLEREGEGFDETWTLTDGKTAPADAEQVDNYMREWEFAVATRTLESPSAEDFASFGFAEPRATITFSMGRAEVSIVLGSAEPVDGGGYLRIDDEDRAIVVPPSVVELFEVEPSAFRVENDAGAPDLDDLLGDSENEP